MSKADVESNAYQFGNKILGPMCVTIAIWFSFALPIWIFWNGTLCDIFPIIKNITYLDSFNLCVLVWCVSRVWKGAPDVKNKN